MAVELQNKVNTAAPTGPFPYGDLIDETGINNGTPVDRAVYGDFHQFFARLLDKSLITPNGLPENATNGWQYYEALKSVANQYSGVNTYSSNTGLVDADFGALSVMDVNGTFDFTLPQLAVGTVLQKIVLMKLGTGTCAVLPFAGDTISPSENIYLKAGDTIVLVSFGFGWLVESRHKAQDYPVTVFASGTANITERELRGMNIINFSGNTTVNLPAITGAYAGQMIAFQKQQGGVATLVPNGADIIYPSTTITLVDGDCVILQNVIGVHWMVISRFTAADFVIDPWHQVGAVGEPPFIGGWVNSGGFAALEFKKVGNRVYVRGTITTTINAPSICALPANYCPTAEQYSIAQEVGTNTVWAMRINPAGTLHMMAGVWAGLDFGISFNYLLD